MKERMTRRENQMTRRGLFTWLATLLAGVPFLGKLLMAAEIKSGEANPDWPQVCIHGKPIGGPWCEDCRQARLCAAWVEDANPILADHRTLAQINQQNRVTFSAPRAQVNEGFWSGIGNPYWTPAARDAAAQAIAERDKKLQEGGYPPATITVALVE